MILDSNSLCYACAKPLVHRQVSKLSCTSARRPRCTFIVLENGACLCKFKIYLAANIHFINSCARHWGTEAVKTLLSPELRGRIKEVWTDPSIPDNSFYELPIYAGHSGELLGKTPDRSMRVTRRKMRKLFSEGINIQVRTVINSRGKSLAILTLRLVWKALGGNREVRGWREGDVRGWHIGSRSPSRGL